MDGPYKRSKFEAERIVRRLAAQGAPVVTVCPTATIGAEDEKPTPTGRLILDFMRGRIPAYVDTGLNFVHVRDVAEGHLLALERGTPGARYLLGNVDGNLTLQQALLGLAAITGRPPPRFRVPHAIALAAAYTDTFLSGAMPRRTPRLPLEGTRMAAKRMWVDPSWSVQALDSRRRRLRKRSGMLLTGSSHTRTSERGAVNLSAGKVTCPAVTQINPSHGHRSTWIHGEHQPG